MLRSLILETVTWTPALEIGGEAALARADAGGAVAFCFLDVENPDNPPRFPYLARTGLWNRTNKARQLESALAARGISVLAAPELATPATTAIREYAHGRPDTIAALRLYSYGPAALGEGVAASILSRTSHSNPDLTRLGPLLRGYLELAATTFELAAQLIRTYAPSELITYNGRYAAGAAVAEAARLADVPVLLHETGATMDRYELYSQRPQDPWFIQSEIKRCWNAAGVDRAVIGATYFRDEPHGDNSDWDALIGVRSPLQLPRTDPRRRRVVFFTTCDFGEEYPGRRESGLFQNQRVALAHLAQWASSRTDVSLIIREYPGSRCADPADRVWLEAMRGPNVLLVRSEDPLDGYELTRSADVVVTPGLLIGLVATFVGIPSVSIDVPFYGGFGCTHQPVTIDELTAMLEDPSLVALPAERCLPAGHWLARHGTPTRYYQATTLHSGRFLGVELSGAATWLRRTGVSSVIELCRKSFA